MMPSLPPAPSPDSLPALEEQRALIALSLVSGVGPGRIRALVARFGSALAALHASSQALATVPGIGAQTAAAIASFDDHGAVDAQVQRAEQQNITLLPAWDERFPRLLRQIYDPPAFLWVRGALSRQDERAIAIVGTRRASEYGWRMAREFAVELAQRGFTVISGLAYGIDAAAHRGALEAGGRTLAVLGSGADRIYPAKHARLAGEIAEQGAVLSEYPLGAAPDAPNFPRRNRVISGLSLGVLVVEAYEKGGALITARLAVEQNREVFALPSAVHHRAGMGANRLIQRGHAKLVLTVDDMLDELGFADQPQASTSEADAKPVDLSPIELTIYDALGPEPLHIDALCVKTGHDASTALVYLLSLEFKGLVRQMAGKQFYRA
ncbi:MAG: DNA-processing protein DprA [Rhodothermales bacterium]